jgi:DNA-binding beta-propeller fold protein YncE
MTRTTIAMTLALAMMLSTRPVIAAAPAPVYTPEASIAGPDGGWDYASVDPVRNRLYVARSGGIMVVDLATGVVTPQLVTAQRAHQVLAINNGREIIETDGKTALLRFIDADTGAVLGEVATGKKPDAAIIDPASGLIVVANADDGSFTLVDPKTRTAAGSITVGGSLEFLAADGRGTIWVNAEDTNELVAVDIRRRKVTARVALTGCDAPTGLAFVAGGKRLISACANGIATIVDPAARRMVGTLAIGKGPDAVKFDDKRGLAFIPCGGDGVLEVISAARADNIRVVGHVKTAISARTAALDPRTGKLYLPSATLLPPEPGAKRGAPKPGSFAIIVIAPDR